MTEFSGNSGEDFNPANTPIDPHEHLRASTLPEVGSMYLDKPNPGHPPYHCYLSTTRSIISTPEGLDANIGEAHTGIYDLFRAAGVNAVIHNVPTLQGLSQTVQAEMGELHNVEPNKDGQRLDKRYGLPSDINDLTIVYRGADEDSVKSPDSRSSLVRSRWLEKPADPRIKSAAELRRRTEAIGHTILEVSLPTEQLIGGELSNNDIQKMVTTGICRAMLLLQETNEKPEATETERRGFAYVVLPSWYPENSDTTENETPDVTRPQREALVEQLVSDFGDVVDVQFRPDYTYDEDRHALPPEQQGDTRNKYPLPLEENELVPGYVDPEYSRENLAQFLTAKWASLRSRLFGRR